MPSAKRSAQQPPAPPPGLPPAQVFRAAIASAQAEGAEPSAMLLRLTRGDEAKLRRDRGIPLEDIRFADGEMRFLGVRIVTGETSALVISPE